MVFGSMAKAPNFSVAYTKDQQKIRDQIEKELLAGGWSPKPMKELCPDKKCLAVLDSMDDCLIRLDSDIVMHREYYEKAKALMLAHAKANGSISLAEFRDMLSTSRKYAVALLDFYDKLGITLRQEDVRVLTGKEV